jgi:hypothetical protein
VVFTFEGACRLHQMPASFRQALFLCAGKWVDSFVVSRQCPTRQASCQTSLSFSFSFHFYCSCSAWTEQCIATVMVGTRNHPGDFPPAVESPIKRTTRSSETTTTTFAPPSSTNPKLSSKPNKTSPPASTTPIMSSLNQTGLRRSPPTWCHTVPAFTIPWLALSLPLVLWDTIYIMGRPHTFTGGAIAWPMYKPYELYGRVDPVYSPEAYYSGLGWTGAQGLGNIFETLAYLAYLWIVVAHGQDRGRGEGVLGSLGAVGKKRTVEGYWGAVSSLAGYTTFMITVAKSVLYCKLLQSILVDVKSLICIVKGTMMLSWDSPSGTTTRGSISPLSLRYPSKSDLQCPRAKVVKLTKKSCSFAWILVPTYLSYIFAVEILEGLTLAAGGERKTR